ncbi:VOC family protein [Lentilactobacillus sp. Marseille-Q4993]|uniref:VOC family protein n=1 Tax=Lentilactobacillus sp. Marseille-Q4993 TaxID=3039492 RepID=UPI0024BD0CA4|nr:VOC family protein [Lentilactobacillus sp. Marseille-Q4993]
MNTELVPYLTFENTKSALEYYERVFGADSISRESPTAKQAADMALNADVDLDELTLQGSFKILGKEFMCADSFLGKPVISSLISLMFRVDMSSDEASDLESLYKRVVGSEEVKVIVSYEKKSSGNKYGQIVDKYGITWIFNAVK